MLSNLEYHHQSLNNCQERGTADDSAVKSKIFSSWSKLTVISVKTCKSSKMSGTIPSYYFYWDVNNLWCNYFCQPILRDNANVKLINNLTLLQKWWNHNNISY